MEFIIISGLSGAGKSRAAAALEDMGVYCVDNMPVELLPQLAEIFLNMQEKYQRVALVTDIRAWGGANELLFALDELRSQGIVFRILFLYADMPTLIKRYKETRRCDLILVAICPAAAIRWKRIRCPWKRPSAGRRTFSSPSGCRPRTSSTPRA